MRKIELLICLVAVGCGGTVVNGVSDAGNDAGVCEAGAYPIGCPNGPVLYCCPPGAHCDPPSCNQPEAGDCPDGQVLLIPCCGGFNDQSCSNGPGPPPPFCTAVPPTCNEQSCTVGGCEGAFDESTRTLSCNCI